MAGMVICPLQRRPFLQQEHSCSTYLTVVLKEVATVSATQRGKDPAGLTCAAIPLTGGNAMGSWAASAAASSGLGAGMDTGACGPDRAASLWLAATPSAAACKWGSSQKGI